MANLLVPLGLPYRKLPLDAGLGREVTSCEMTALLLKTAIALRYPDKMPRQESRMWARLLNQLEEEPVPDQLACDDTTFKWLLETVDKADYPAAWSSWRWVLLDHLAAMETG